MIYLDNSATSRFKPKQVINAVMSELYNSSNSGRGAHNDAITLGYKIFETRQNILKYFNATDYNVIFTKNCTEALNIAIQGTAKIGGHIITTCYEHNSVLRTLTYLEKTKNIRFDILFPKNHIQKTNDLVNNRQYLQNKDLVITADEIEKHIRPNTNLVIINHISNVLGVEENIEEIAYLCKKYSIMLLIDGAQSVGHKQIDIDRLGITMLASAGHKGLGGVQGTGFLVVNNHTKLNPIMFGGTGTNSINLIQPNTIPEGFEVGTLNSAGILGLNEAINFNRENFNKINDKIARLSKALIENLCKNDKVIIYSPLDTTSGIVSFNIKNMPADFVAKILNDRYDIAVRAGLHCAPLAHKCIGTTTYGTVRVSIGFNNDYDDIEKLTYAINEITKD